MRIVQFEIPAQGRRLGVVVDEQVRDVTATRPDWQRLVDVFHSAQTEGRSLGDLLSPLVESAVAGALSYPELLQADSECGKPFLHPPVDHEDPHRVVISGTGLTHLGSMESRNQMHTEQTGSAAEPKTDSKKIFEMGLAGGKPVAGRRGVAPEWFFKGNGLNLRGHRQSLEVPDFAGDGGEEAELVGCYVIDKRGVPRRLGFALGNEWSDHATEKMNYLYLAPSKLRQCAVGPELVTDFDFQELRLRCTVTRDGRVVYDSGELLSGERHMCHSLANCEDHHFKYPQHRQPGDVHLHYFGTSKLSHAARDWLYTDGDEIRIEATQFGATQFGAALVNTVHVTGGAGDKPVGVEPA